MDEITELAENNSLLSCLNIVYKLYIDCFNQHHKDDCGSKKQSEEQAGGKKGVGGCTEQHLINKAVQSEMLIKERKSHAINL